MKSVISKLCSVLLTTSLIVSVAWTAPNQKEVLAAAKATIPDETWVEVDAGTYTGDEILAMDDTDTGTKYLKLAGDVTVSDSLQISETVYLDLAGYTLDSEGSSETATIIVNSGATLNISDSSMTSTKPGSGKGKVLGGTGRGCIESNGRSLTITGGTYTGAEGQSAIKVDGGSLTISSTIITGNDSSEYSTVNGGGICVENSTISSSLNISDCVISNNKCGGNGGGISIDNKDNKNIYLTRCDILNNESAGNGGGLFFKSSPSTNSYYSCSLSDCTIEYNQAQGNGGGIFAKGEKKTKLSPTDVTIENNSALKGGGIYLDFEGTACRFYCAGNITVLENSVGNLYFEDRSFYSWFENNNVTGKIGVTYGGDWNPIEAGFNLCQNSYKAFWLSDDPNYTIEPAGQTNVMVLQPKNEQQEILKNIALSFTSTINVVLQFALPQGADISASSFSYEIGSTGKTVSFEAATLINESENIYQFLIPVYVTDLTESISYSISYWLEGYKPVNFDDTSVMDIAMEYVTDPKSTASTIAVARALLLYGAAAEGRFSSNPSNPAELVDPISAEEKSNITSTYLNGCILDKIEPANISDNSIEYYGSTLFFLSDNTLRHYFYVRDDIENYTFYFGGDEVEVRQVGETKFYYIQKAGLGAADIATQFSVVVEKTVNEETVTVFDFSYSAKNYLAKILANADEHDQSMIDLAYAACLYFDAVASYTPPTDSTPDP